jgi:hypothetical protein
MSRADVRGFGATGAAAWGFSDSAAPTVAQASSLVTDQLATAWQLVYLRQRPVVLFGHGGGLWQRTSDNDGVTWNVATELTSGFDFIAADIGPDGGTVYVIGKRVSTIKCLLCSLERLADGTTTMRIAEEFTPEGLDDISGGSQLLKLQNGVFHLLVGSGGRLTYYRSEDGMRTWN